MQGDGDTRADRCSLTPDLSLPALDNARPPDLNIQLALATQNSTSIAGSLTENPGRVLHSKRDGCLQADLVVNIVGSMSPCLLPGAWC